MELFRHATSVYGEDQFLGANWDLIAWFAGAAAAFMVVDAAVRLLMKSKPPVAANAAPGEVRRHGLLDRLYHWTMALCVLTLLVTAFAPILGWKFAWVAPHWIAGVVLAALVAWHIVRAAFFQDIWAMLPDRGDFSASAKPGKYPLLQKAYHWAVAALVVTLIGTGAPMWLKVDTPFWRRNPYILSDDSWAIVYSLHDFCAMATLAIVAVHVYFALRPDKWWQNRSMFTGRVARADYLARHDVKRWKAEDA